MTDLKEVWLTSTAEHQLDEIAGWYASERPEVAAAWFNGLLDKLKSLAENSLRYSIARESEALGVPFRQALYGVGRKNTHRILFTVRDDRVVVHMIRHVSQDDVNTSDF